MNFFMLISHTTCCANSLPTLSISLESGVSLQQELAGYCTNKQPHGRNGPMQAQAVREFYEMKFGTRQHESKINIFTLLSIHIFRLLSIRICTLLSILICTLLSILQMISYWYASSILKALTCSEQ